MSHGPERTDTHEVTRLLRRAAERDEDAFNRLLPLVYDHLKVVATARLRDHAPNTLNPTALVHEAYLKLVDHADVAWDSRAHFYAIASSAMRQIIVDHARARGARKRGAGAPHLPLDDESETGTPEALVSIPDDELIELNDALDRLEAFDARGAKVVQYRFFGGLTNRETADVLGTSEVTVRRAWTAARSWLRAELRPAGAGE